MFENDKAPLLNHKIPKPPPTLSLHSPLSPSHFHSSTNSTMAAATAFPGCAAVRSLPTRPLLRAVRCSASSACPSYPPPSPPPPESETPPKPDTSRSSFFPKRGQTVELVCESLAFKGKGVCRVADSGFVVMCDRALPGERFLGRVTRKKGNYAEVSRIVTAFLFCRLFILVS